MITKFLLVAFVATWSVSSASDKVSNDNAGVSQPPVYESSETEDPEYAIIDAESIGARQRLQKAEFFAKMDLQDIAIVYETYEKKIRKTGEVLGSIVPEMGKLFDEFYELTHQLHQKSMKILTYAKRHKLPYAPVF